ncbi:MAG: choice-of-anchor Q domain-containing protein, partial [Lewinella sp.]
DQNNEDYGLQANSPAIDAGATTALTIDAAQTARPQGGGPDLGPFEYQAPRVFVVELNTWFPSIQAAIDAVPNGTLGTLYIPAGSYPENVNTGAKMIRILFGLP